MNHHILSVFKGSSYVWCSQTTQDIYLVILNTGNVWDQELTQCKKLYVWCKYACTLSFQISYASSVIELSNRQRFPNFFRTYPSDANFIPSIRSLMKHFGWERLAVITEEETLFLDVWYF